MTDLLLAPADAAAREAALDIGRSVIVQAPAGSGKTDLLTRRFLRLLAVVDEPEAILAITFTRAATAEMRNRILADLEAAADRRAPRPDEQDRITLAREALAQSERRGWDILNHPERLAVETIDSLCLRIAHDRPLLAGLGGRLQPTEDAAPLYALAARRTLQQLGGADAELDQALAHLLDLRDNRLSACEDLLARMLATRDQWIHAFPLSGNMTEELWEIARTRLEAPFRREEQRVLAEAHRLLAEQPAIAAQIVQLVKYACSQGSLKISLLDGIEELSASMPAAHWSCLCSLLMTEKNEWRRTVTKKDGFPSDTREEKQRRADMLNLLDWLARKPALLAALCAVRNLPPHTYSDAQWTTLRHVLTVLRRAIAELRVVFAELNAVDFTEISIAAQDVLENAPDRVAGIGSDTRHLLVDEFQDTSRRQHELVTALLAAWDLSEHRTVFLVGDPMQSIYMFRQAEVELFTHVLSHGIGAAGNRVRCHPVQLSVNFRSHSGLTEPLNTYFTAICAEPAPPGAAAVQFAPATASDTAPSGNAVHIHPQIIGSAAAPATPDESREARSQEAQEILAILERHLPEITCARAEHREFRVAVLVRARPHLASLIPLLHERRIPFRAVEIDRLSDRQELLDLRSLTRALLHPMDRIAALAVLRAPWCGLTLADLHRLTGADDPTFKHLSVPELIERNQHLLSADGQQRLARTTQILRRALELRWRPSESPSFASWIERTWRTLGGPACLDATAQENAEVFFTLLDAVTPDGLAPITPAFDAQLDRLFAQPDPSGGVELMTMHKAKGLGFDVVIVPGLHRKPKRDDKPLIVALERRDPFSPTEDEFLVAPLGAQGDDRDPLYKWVEKQRKIRFDEERKRLFYVACTRARRELHLLGTATLSSKGLQPGDADSLLATAWPALRTEFEALQQLPAAAPSNVLAFPTPSVVAEMAAVTEADPPVPVRSFPRRLPIDFEPASPAQNVTVTGANLLSQPDPPEFRRAEGSRQARVIGSVVHALLQRLTLQPGAQLAEFQPDQLRARAASLLRASALTGDALASATATVTNLLLACAADPVCQWILAPHPEAQSEASWSGFTASRLRTLRADRVFRAGRAPLAAGSDCLWVIDYKTGHSSQSDPQSNEPSAARDAFLARQRTLFAPQLLAYARVLRSLHGAAVPIRLGLYYPALATLDHWAAELESSQL